MIRDTAPLTDPVDFRARSIRSGLKLASYSDPDTPLMLTKPCCALIGLLSLWPLPAVAQQAPWVLSGAGAAQYTLLTATGSAPDRTGATLTLRSDTAKPSAFGTILARTPADSFRGRKVRLSAAIDAP